MKTHLLVVIVSLAVCSSPTLAAEPSYKLNKAQKNVVALSGLGSGDPCGPGKLTGRVVSVRYADNDVAIQSFTIAHEDGTRTFVNVDNDQIQTGSMVAIAWIQQGLQQYIRKGKNVSIGALYCGAAGRVVVLDSIGSK